MCKLHDYYNKHEPATESWRFQVFRLAKCSCGSWIITSITNDTPWLGITRARYNQICKAHTTYKGACNEVKARTGGAPNAYMRHTTWLEASTKVKKLVLQLLREFPELKHAEQNRFLRDSQLRLVPRRQNP